MQEIIKLMLLIKHLLQKLHNTHCTGSRRPMKSSKTEDSDQSKGLNHIYKQIREGGMEIQEVKHATKLTEKNIQYRLSMSDTPLVCTMRGHNTTCRRKWKVALKM